MSDIVSGILKSLGTDGIAKIASSLGADESSVNSTIVKAIPTMLAGLANNAGQGGADSLASALDDHEPSIFNQLGSLLGGDNMDGSKILGHIFGNQQEQTQNNLASKGGLGIDSVIKLLPILAPLVMGYLSKRKKEENLNSGSLSEVLRKETEQVEENEPGLLDSILGSAGGSSMVKDILGNLLK